MVGIPVTIEYDQAWDGLTQNLMCRCSPWNSNEGEIRTILNVGETSTVAHEVMQAGMYLYLGVEGFSSDGKLVIPTTWARCGKIEYGANTCDDLSTEPELPIWNQLQIEMEKTKEYVLTPEQATNIQAYAREATQSAQEAQQAAEEAKQAVESGLYYIPSVSQPTDTTLKFEFKPTVTGAPIPKPVTVELPVSNGSGNQETSAGIYYIATDYGISTDAEDNTPALQALVDSVSADGGGIIFFPSGVYAFGIGGANDNQEYAILMKNNVSIIGENTENTVFKQTVSRPYSMFYRHGTADDPLVGCSFHTLTVDAYDTGNVNQVYGKAFFFQYLRDCVFRDIRLLGTVATAMGVDFLDNVVIDNVFLQDCGRTFTGQSGSSGIGIGTGGWENENFRVTNCVCVGCGQYGIFIENQKIMNWGGTTNRSKGAIIANCIARNGRNKGIGIRSGVHITVANCQTYENAADGIYMDGLCEDVHISDCIIADNSGAGINIATTKASAVIVADGNTITGNAKQGVIIQPGNTLSDMIISGNNIFFNGKAGIDVESVVDGLCLRNNYTKGNSTGVYLGSYAVADAVIRSNVLMEGYEIIGEFTGITDFNDFVSGGGADVVHPTSITVEDISISAGAKTTALNVSVSPSNAGRMFTYSSSNEDVFTVSASGEITAVAEGSATITVKSYWDETVFGEATVTVGPAAPLYPLTDGSHTFKTSTHESTATVSGGRHFHIACASGTIDGGKINLSNIQNNLGQNGNVGNINNQSEIYTLSAGDEVTLTASNIVANAGVTSFKLGLRNTATGNVVAQGGDNITANVAGETTVTAVVESDASVGCLYTYWTISEATELEFDVVMTVNGVRYV